MSMSKPKEKFYKMKFVPFDEAGVKKRGAPFVGEERGFEVDQIVLLPLSKRWESWWELVDDKVPKTVLERDQKKRNDFLEKAKISAAARAKELEADEALTRGRPV